MADRGETPAPGLAAFRSILCAIDSATAGPAARQAALLAGPGTELSILVVVGDEPAAGDGAERTLDDAVSLAAERGIVAVGRMARGGNVARLLQDAGDGADLLVVDAPGGDTGDDVLLGTMASSAVHTAPLPVLVSRTPPEGREFPRDILVAADGSPDSERGVQLAGRIAGAHNARIALVHIADGRSEPHRALGRDADLVEKDVGARPATIEEFGNPAERIAEVVRRERGSLLVIGSRGVGRARTLGSVSERLAHEAPCSVLVTRPSAR